MLLDDGGGGLIEDTIVIHLLGTEEELDNLLAFQLLMGLYPSKQIIIRMFCPSIPKEFQPTKSMVFTNPETRSKLSLYFYPDVYTAEDNAIDPRIDLILAMNANLMGHQSWVDTIKYFVKERKTCFFTEAMEPQVDIAKKNLSNIGAVFKVDVELNAFRQPLNLWTPDTNLPGFSNGFLFGI